MRCLTLLVLALLAPAARAQEPLDPSAPPVHGVVRLRSGFAPDPVTRPVRAGGAHAARVGRCGGFVAGPAPTLALRFAPGRFALTFTARPDDGAPEADLVLIVRTPGGKWLCDDDADGDLHPRLVLRRPRAGAYAVWVGAFDAGAAVPARVGISEFGRGAGE